MSSSSPQQQNNTENKEKKKQQQPKQLTFKEKFCVWGGISYFILPPILTSLTSKSSPETKDKLDNLLTPKDSAARSIVNAIQFISRCGLVAGAGVLTGVVSLISSIVIVGGGAGYFLLSTPDFNLGTILKKPSIIGLFAVGVPVGAFGLWPRDFFNRYDASGTSNFVSVGSNYITIVTLSLMAGGLATIEKGRKVDRIADDAEKAAAVEKSVAAKLAEKAGDVKIGTVEVNTGSGDNKSSTTTTDVTLKDALNFAKEAAESSEERINRWVKRPENVFFITSRLICGTLWGFLARAYFEFMKATFLPVIKSLLFGGESDVITFLVKGFRGIEKCTAARAAAFKAAEVVAKQTQ